MKQVRITLAFKERLIEITDLEPSLHLPSSDSTQANEIESEEKEDDFDDNDYLDEIDPKVLYSEEIDKPSHPLLRHFIISKSNDQTPFNPNGTKSDLNVTYLSNSKDRSTKFKKCMLMHTYF